MNVRILIGVAAAVVACTSPPPPIGSEDSGADTGKADVEADAAPVEAGDDGATEASTCTSLVSPPANQTCATCIQSTCCDTWNECQGNSDCLGYVACAQACAGAGDAGADAGDGGLQGGDTPDGGDGGGLLGNCYTKCQIQFPNGVNDGIVIVDCEDNGCAGSCP